RPFSASVDSRQMRRRPKDACQTHGNLWHSLKNLANSGRKVRNALDGKRAFCIGRIKMATRGHLGISCLPPLPFRHHSLDPEASAGEVLLDSRLRALSAEQALL